MPHTRTETDNLLVRCVLEDGSEGYGEDVPRDYVTGETITSAFDLLSGSDLAGQCEDCRDFEQAGALAERLRLAPVPGDERGCEGNAARRAVELALLDAYGRSFDRSLSGVIRLLPLPPTEPPAPFADQERAFEHLRQALEDVHNCGTRNPIRSCTRYDISPAGPILPQWRWICCMAWRDSCAGLLSNENMRTP